MNKLFSKACLFVLVLALFAPLSADEGMWLYNAPPSKWLMSKYNFEATPEWLSHFRLSSVRFGGASASFVSAEGLVLTNHHVGQGLIQNLSTKERDLMKTGFVARSRSEELNCPGGVLWVLEQIEDVTPQVLGTEKQGTSPAEAAEAREKVIARLEKDCSDKTGLKCAVVNLFSGGMYHLYQYKVYTDIRLVFAPEYATAFFGGDPDNFTYPRYDLDISLFRVYENGKPGVTPHYLKWSTKPLREGDLVFCSGNPGSTGRLLTYSQLEFLRDLSYPFILANYKRRQSLLHEYSSRGAEETRIALRNLFGIENSLKATTGYQSGLLDAKLMAKKSAEEKELREAISKNPDLQKIHGLAWDEIAEAQKRLSDFFKPLACFERGQAFNAVYFGIARSLVRLAQEKGKPNSERLREFRDSNLASVQRSLLSPSPIYDEFEIYKLTDSLKQFREELAGYQEISWLLGDRRPEDVAGMLVSGTKLKSLEVRKQYIEGGIEAVNLSEDPMIKLALLVDPVSRGLRSRYEKEVEAVENKNGALIAQAMFKLRGTSIAPDATGTLRLSFGVVKSYTENGRKIPYETTFAGLYDHSKRYGDKPPYELPPSFIAKRGTLSLGAPLNFVATCDSIGGNSGSPLVNRKGEFVGVLFDGNIQSLPSRFVYEDETSRSVIVHGLGIIEALGKVYDAGPLVDEILGKK